MQCEDGPAGQKARINGACGLSARRKKTVPARPSYPRHGPVALMADAVRTPYAG